MAQRHEIEAWVNPSAWGDPADAERVIDAIEASGTDDEAEWVRIAGGGEDDEQSASERAQQRAEAMVADELGETRGGVMTLTIEHTEAEGTLLLGTSRGDGSAEVVKALGWRWGRSIGLWFVPRSRDAAPKRPLIEQTARQLREAGFEVEVSIDTTTGDREEAEARRAERSQARSGRLADLAEREQAKADQRYAASRKIADGIPFGQPILLGHHSQARAERDARKIRSHMEASIEHQERANAAAAAAATAAAGPEYRHNPVTVANRIERLGAEIRRMERALEQSAAAGHRRQDLEDQLAIDRADLEHWQKVRAEQLETGQATNYSRETVAVGDLVKIGGSWHTVARCNAKTVAVQTGYSWTNKAPWHKVQDHRPRPEQG